MVDDIEVSALTTSLASQGSWKQGSLRLKQTVFSLALHTTCEDLVSAVSD